MNTETTALAVSQSRQQFDLSPQSFEQALTFAQYLADSDMVPKDFKGKPANCLIGMQWGMELGMKPLQAIQNIAVINAPPNPCAKRYALAECRAAEQAAPVRDSRDEEAWQALGFLSGLHGCMTIDADQPMKMAQAIFDHVQSELKHWRDEAAKSRAMLVDLAKERGELARWKIAQAAAVDVGAAQAAQQGENHG